VKFPRISVIIPTLNEAGQLADTLSAVRRALPEAECIVSDGGSTDPTWDIARTAEARLVAGTTPGRGPQLRAGAAVAAGDWLLFLHADTHLAANAGGAVNPYLAGPKSAVATFRVTYSTGHAWWLRRSAWLARFDSVFTRFGDHGILIRTDLYRAIGGFPDWPLFEDVELLRRARRRCGRIDLLAASVTTSDRRFAAVGAGRQQVRNAWLLVRFLAGADPHRLAREYPSADRLPTRSDALPVP